MLALLSLATGSMDSELVVAVFSSEPQAARNRQPEAMRNLSWDGMFISKHLWNER
jgi:hypothetical protein